MKRRSVTGEDERGYPPFALGRQQAAPHGRMRPLRAFDAHAAPAARSDRGRPALQVESPRRRQRGRGVAVGVLPRDVRARVQQNAYGGGRAGRAGGVQGRRAARVLCVGTAAALQQLPREFGTAVLARVVQRGAARARPRCVSRGRCLFFPYFSTRISAKATYKR